MNTIEIKARAKINFSIDVVGKRENGYHDVKMVMQSLELHDVLQIEKIASGIELECSASYVPKDQTNIAYNAAALFIERYDIKEGIRIVIEKNIPVSAGLAGGSTDAAAVLRGMNIIFGVNADLEELCELGLKCGADVPYCIKGGTSLAEGLGEVLTPIAPLKKTHIVLIKPDFGVSTKWVYESLILEKIVVRPNTELIINSIKSGDVESLGRNMINVLENITCEKYPVISEIKKELMINGAVGSIMSGSGSAVFGVFENYEKAKNAAKNLQKEDREVFLTETFSETQKF
jgi:4-diphosphocytidyl-2-C-methyl-D-erythritol kinase